jgi:Nitroreductase family
MPATEDKETVLRHAAAVAASAPSIFNTQPWRWQVGRKLLRLWADRDRQLVVADPEGRMLTISCGVGLHHARTAIAAAGHEAAVYRLPDPLDPDLFATIDLDGAHEPTQEELTLYHAIPRRRTDRRAFGPDPVPESVAAQLVAAAERQGARLHLVNRDQISRLALAAAQASAVQLADPAYRRELINWTHRPPWSGDGVPTATAVNQSPRRVPVRQFAPFGGPVMDAGPQTDLRSLYAIVFTETDEPIDWLRAGEALSAVLLTATGEGLGTAPISDVTELSITRDALRSLLPEMGVPQLAARVGQAPPGSPPNVPRRSRDEVIFP